ncbi:recombinase family protein [Paraburkholderia caffeinilytica]|uniref:recombinase family protein n=1 Tax=Paraburkholderia caffeinilytica TaxID=1761016 RepID=UPI003DA0C4D5
MPSASDGHSGFTAPRRAAQYVRMSTDHQQCSPIFQRQAIAEYAAAHNIRIVRDYEDAGISGLTLRERPALIRLLVDVENPACKFTVILVYDVSRWGRFQDVDEAAFYEYTCRRAGVKVIYVAEPFEDDASPTTCVMKALKRAMAGEFSREISRKVFLGHCVNVQRGYHSGGPPGYGLQRVLVDTLNGSHRALAPYQYKSLQTDRVILAPGPPHETALVRKMFEWYAARGTTATDVARRLNDFGICNGVGRPWMPRNILQILRNEKYVGTNVYSRTSSKLDAAWEQLPTEEWIRVPGAFDPVVGNQLFAAVQRKLARCKCVPNRDEIVAGLRKVIEKTGTLNQATLRRYRSAPSVERIMREFGSLYEAYEAIGYAPRLNPERSRNRHTERRTELSIADITADELRKRGHAVKFEKHTNVMCVDNALRLQLVVRSSWLVRGHSPYWIARWPDCFAIDFLVYARIERADPNLLDFHLFPRGSLTPGAYTVIQRNGVSRFEDFRHPDLRSIIELTDCVPLEVLDFAHGASAT